MYGYRIGDDVKVDTRQDGHLVEGKGLVAQLGDQSITVQLTSVFEPERVGKKVGDIVVCKINEVTLLERV